jgi:hypothetical protein
VCASLFLSLSLFVLLDQGYALVRAVMLAGRVATGALLAATDRPDAGASSLLLLSY